MSIYEPPFSQLDGLADKTIGVSGCDPDLKVAPRGGHDRLCGAEINRLVLAATACNLASGGILTLNHHLDNLPYVPGVIHSLNLSLAIEQHLKPG
jgi:hypothetical protein